MMLALTRIDKAIWQTIQSEQNIHNIISNYSFLKVITALL